MRPIDADALIKSIIKVLGIRNEEYFTVQESVIVSEIYNAPTIEPKQEWIPCSERLPEENKKEYLVFLYGVSSKNGWCQVLNYEDGWNCSNGDKSNEIKDVVAWMPLPEPYKEREDDE